MTRKKKITLGCLGLLLAGLAVLSYVRWNVWFGNPPEAPYAPQPTPSRVLLTFGNDGALSRNVSWQCDSVLHTSHLELAFRPPAKCFIPAAARAHSTWHGSLTWSTGNVITIVW